MQHLCSLPLPLSWLQPFEFPHKLGICERLFGSLITSNDTCWVQTGADILWKLDLANLTHRWIVCGQYEGAPFLKWAQKFLLPNGIVVDSGANIGQMPLYLAQWVRLYNFIWRWNRRYAPLLFRGDSHTLLPSTGAKEWARQKFISLIYRRFSACLYVGKANYGYFRAHGVLPQNLFFPPHAVDNDRFKAHTEEANRKAVLWKQELGIAKNRSVILFAGKFELKKRPLDLLQAFLQANLPRISLLFVGAGAEERDLRSQAAHPHVHFAPFQNQSLMPRTYATADLGILPSYGSGETWGLAINEAMCMSRSVIASTHVGCASDLIQSYRNGLIFPAGDVSTLAACLKEAFSDRERLQMWGEESRKIVGDYSYTQTSQGLRKALTSLGISFL